MTLLQIAVLAIVQGITEFLPISSSGHLIMVPELVDWPDQGLTIDIAVHVGTLLAVMVYFHRDLWAMLSGLFHLILGRSTPGARLAGYIVAATVPVLVAGYLVKTFAGDSLRSIELIGWTTLGFGLLLLVADRVGMTVRRIEHMNLTAAGAIGVAQMLALIPGTSRSGITMTAARFLGYERAEAARFSLLLSMPTIFGAGVLAGLGLAEQGDQRLGMDAAIAAAIAFVTALIAIAAMLRWLRHARFTPFVVYRVILGAGLLSWVYF